MNLRILLLSLAVPAAVPAAIVVDPGVVRVALGTSSVQIPVSITGGDALTDFAGLVEVGNPPSAGPLITAVSYTGSIWENAAGGYLSFFAGSPPAATVGPNISLNAAGQSVAGSGVLLTLTVSIAGLPAGDYPVKFINTAGGDSLLANGASVVPASFAQGIIRIMDDAVLSWRLTNFPGTAANPALESTVWGDLADPDRDGITNLVEFYCGTNPNVPSLTPASLGAPGLPVISFTDIGGQSYSTLSYTRRIVSAPVSAEVQSSGNLELWTGTGFVDASPPVPLPGGLFEFISRRSIVPVNTANRRSFLRLKVTHSSP